MGPGTSVTFNPRGARIRHDGGMTSESWHVSERIDRSAAEVYGYASDPASLARWAPGLGSSVEQVGGQWFVDTPRDACGSLSRRATTSAYSTITSRPDLGEVIYVPMRVIADGDGCEVVLTVRRLPGMTDEEFKADGAAVAADLARLKRLLED